MLSEQSGCFKVVKEYATNGWECITFTMCDWSTT